VLWAHGCSAISGLSDLTFDLPGAGGAPGGGPPTSGGGGEGGSESCRSNAECDDREPCTNDRCNAQGKCEHTDVADGTAPPGYVDIPDDCVRRTCVGGVGRDVAVATDNPDVDPLDCIVETCDGPSIVVTNEREGSPCGVAGECNDMGQCTGCNTPSDCGAETECRSYACINRVCVTQDVADGTPLPAAAQTSRDCQELQCNGSGGIHSVDDNGDLPVDANPCTDDVCSDGVPSNPFEPQGTSCGGGAICDGAGTCCTPATCASLGKTCGTAPNSCGGGNINCNSLTQNGAETDVDCGGPTSSCATRCAQGDRCSVTGDCGAGLFCVDGVCCNTSCTSPCRSCSVPGQEGICVMVAPFQADPPVCAGNAGCSNGSCVCSPSGTCAGGPGAPCSIPNQCASGVCQVIFCL
jgi:hypothetical protein